MNAYEIARAEATRVVEAAYRKAVAAGELPEGTIPPGEFSPTGHPPLPCSAQSRCIWRRARSRRAS